MGPFLEGLSRRYEKTIDNLNPDDDFTNRCDSDELVDEYEDIFAGEDLAFVGEDLAKTIASMIDPDTWVESDFAVPHHGDQLSSTWTAFCHAVKVETKYTLLATRRR